MQTEAASKARRFAKREDAIAAAKQITDTPRKGVAYDVYVGAYDAWIVEVRPRAKPYCNPRVLQEDGSIR